MRVRFDAGGGSRVRVRAGCLCALLFVTACGGGDLLHVPPHVRVDARGQTVEGTTGTDETRHFPIVFDAFLPEELEVHPGDNVFFDAEFTGELHTVTMGTLVDDAVAAISELGDDATLQKIEALPEMRKLPSIFPREPGDGPLRANRSATEPCYLEEGEPPNPPEGGAPACPERDQPVFTGRQSFYSSGSLEDETFEVVFSDDVPVGTHHFMCLVHRSAMIGTIEVVEEGEPVPGKPDTTKAADTRVGSLRSSLEPLADIVGRATSGDAVAGGGNPATAPAQIAAFSPERVTLAAGETVSWTVSGLHTITLEPPVGPGDLLVEREGELVFNEEVVAPSGGAPPVPPKTLAFPPGAKEKPVTLSATWDGEGSFSSGLLWSIPPARITYEITFTRPGTYALQCLVHPVMTGVVEVGEEGPAEGSQAR